MKLILQIISALFACLFGIPLCMSAEPPESYSDLLRAAVHHAGLYRGGYLLYSPADSTGMQRAGELWPSFECDERLVETAAIPYLVEVIRNGPDWQEGGDYLRSHIARCYATLCLAATKDRLAYPVLTDLLQNGTWLQDPNRLMPEPATLPEYGGGMGYAARKMPRIPSQDELEKYDIRAYAAIGLGMFGDPNAAAFLLTALHTDSAQMRGESFLALARLGNVRLIEPMMQYAERDHELSQFVVDLAMIRLTGVRFQTRYHREDKTLSFVGFPELGRFDIGQNPHKKVWQHWLKVGRQWTRQRLESTYQDWKRMKGGPLQNIEGNRRWKMTQLGIAALPFLIEKIATGDTELIEQVSQLTRGKVSRDASREEVLQWWDKNSESWTMPFENKP